MNSKHKCGRCGKTFANEWGLKVHTARTHDSRRWRNLHEPSVVISAPIEPDSHIEPQKEAKQRKAYTKKEKVSPSVMFCPCCGTNIKAVSMALHLMGK
jgi:hypothetical protein